MSIAFGRGFDSRHLHQLGGCPGFDGQEKATWTVRQVKVVKWHNIYLQTKVMHLLPEG